MCSPLPSTACGLAQLGSALGAGGVWLQPHHRDTTFLWLHLQHYMRVQIRTQLLQQNKPNALQYESIMLGHSSGRASPYHLRLKCSRWKHYYSYYNTVGLWMLWHWHLLGYISSVLAPDLFECYIFMCAYSCPFFNILVLTCYIYNGYILFFSVCTSTWSLQIHFGNPTHPDLCNWSYPTFSWIQRQPARKGDHFSFGSW